MSYDLWRDVIAESFEDAKIAATPEQIDKVAEWVAGTHDNWSTYTGADCIGKGPDPEIARLEKQIRELTAEKDRIELDFKKNVARRHKVSTSDVTLLGNGDAEYKCL